MILSFKKALINSLLLISLSATAQLSILSKNVPSNLDEYTLLVEQFTPLNPNEKHFKNGDVNLKKQARFIKKYNQKVHKNNKKLNQKFRKYYNYDFKLVEINSSLDSNDFPYIFSRTLIFASLSKSKKFDNGFFTFSHHIFNRQKNKQSRDINLYSRRYWHNVKIIILEMNDYLEGKD